MLTCFESHTIEYLRHAFAAMDYQEQQDFIHDEGTTEDSFVFRLAEELERDGGFSGSLVVVFDPKTRTLSKKEFAVDAELMAESWVDDRAHEAGWR